MTQDGKMRPVNDITKFMSGTGIKGVSRKMANNKEV